MIPVGILTSLVQSAVSKDLTVEYISTVESGSTWDGTHWNRPNVFVGDTGSERVLLIVRGHGSNTSSTGTLFVGSVEAQNLVVSPSRAYAQIWMAILPPSEPSEVTVKHPDGAAMEHHILRLSEPVALVHSVSGLITSGTNITLPPLTAPTTGLHLAFARRRVGQDQIVSMSPIDNLLVPGHEGVGSKEATGVPVTIQAVTSGSDFAAAAAVSLTKIPEIDPGKVIYDSFNRENWASGLGVSDSGHLWRQYGTGPAGISAGQVYRATGSAFALVDFGQKSHRVSARVVADGPYFALPVAGASDANNFYWISGENNGGHMRLKANKNGVETALGVSVGTYVAGDVIGLEVIYGEASSTIRMFKNGVQMGSDQVDSNSDRPKGTMVGLRPAGNTAIRQDDFLAVPPNYWNAGSQLLSDEFDCGVDHSVIAHASAAHTTGPQFVTDTGSSFGVSSASGLLTSSSNTGYGGRVIADVGQPEVKVSARIKGMLTAAGTAQDRHYGLVLGALGVNDATGAVGLHANMGGVISLQQISGSAWPQNLANTGVTFTVTDDFVITLEVKGNVALATVNGKQAMLYLTNPPTGTFAGLYVSRNRWDNTYGYDNITIETL